MGEADKPLQRAGLLAWLICIAGWLACAGLCLWLTIELEAYPNAYDVFFPAILLILFCNILLFLFVAARWAASLARICGAVVRIVVGEGIILGGMYCLGRFFM